MRHRGIVAALALLALTGGESHAQETAPAPPAAPGPAAPPGPATLPDTMAGAAGTWDLALDGGLRRCVLTLALDTGPNGRVVRFPAGCRRALPILSGVAGWLFTGEGIRLVDRNARPLLAFARSSDGMSLGATAENGERYNLVPLQIAAAQPPAPVPVVVAPATEPGSAPQAASPAGAAEAPSPGLYALDRATQKDVCRLEFSSAADPAKDNAAVRVLPDCRDSGITVFDPVSWRFANGHLTLKARRGHAVNLVPLGEGRWRRDPEIGVTLVLRKVEP